MDLRRACRDSMMKLRRDSDVLTPVHWYFAAKGAKFFPGPHLFGTSDWNKQNRVAGQLGEQPTPKVFTLGVNPGMKGSGDFCGTLDDFANGATADSPLHPVDAQGFSPCCLGPGHYRAALEGREQSWVASVKTSAHYETTWSVERRMAAVETDAADFEPTWSHERSLTAEVKTASDYTATWSRERKVTTDVTTASDYEATWSQERSVEADVTTASDYEPTWSHERSVEEAIETEGDYAATWSHERSVTADVATEANYTATWSHERSATAEVKTASDHTATWSEERSVTAEVRTASDHTATWSHERSVTAVVTDRADYTPAWDEERSWTALITTRDNVVTFTCSTLVALGGGQAGAAAIVSDKVSCTSTGIGQGVRLPAGCYRITVRNDNAGGGNPIAVYPPNGAQLGTSGNNNPLSVGPGVVYFFDEVSATQWDYVQLT